MDDAVLAQAHTFIRLLCQLLPCPGCSGHCTSHLTEHPLQELATDGPRLWGYLLDLHNAVNSRTGKRLVSSREARRLVERRAAQTHGRLAPLSRCFDYSHWLVVTLLTDAAHATPALRYALIRSWCAFTPIGAHTQPGDSTPLRQEWRAVPVDTSDRAGAHRAIELLYRAVRPRFHLPPLAPGVLARDASPPVDSHLLSLVIQANAARVRDHATTTPRAAPGVLTALYATSIACVVLGICLAAAVHRTRDRAGPRACGDGGLPAECGDSHTGRGSHMTFNSNSRSLERSKDVY
jgi:hypothetical protein